MKVGALVYKPLVWLSFLAAATLPLKAQNPSSYGKYDQLHTKFNAISKARYPKLNLSLRAPDSCKTNGPYDICTYLFSRSIYGSSIADRGRSGELSWVYFIFADGAGGHLWTPVLEVLLGMFSPNEPEKKRTALISALQDGILTGRQQQTLYLGGVAYTLKNYQQSGYWFEVRLD